MQKVKDNRKQCSIHGPHRRDWPAMLRQILRAKTWRRFYTITELQEVTGQEGWTSKYVILVCICMSWSNASKQIQRFQQARNTVVALFPNRKRPPQSYQGFMKALNRLGKSRIRSMLIALRSEFPALIGDNWTLGAWIPVAVDGSRIEAPRTEANEKDMGQAGLLKSPPQLWVTVLMHLFSNFLWDWRQGRGDSSERHHLRDMLNELPPNALVIGDAGFVGYDLMREMTEAGQSFLIRCGGNIHLLLDDESIEVDQFHTRAGTRVYLWPQDKHHQPPQLLRLIVTKKKNRKVYLLTNVLLTTQLPKRMACELYRARWGVEVYYRSLKQTIGRRRLLCKNPHNARVELAANMLGLFFLVVQSAVVLGRHVYRLSVSLALEAIRKATEALRWKRNWTGFFKEIQVALKDEYKRHSKKETRDWPNKTALKPPGPPKFRMLNCREVQKIKMYYAESYTVG